MKLAIFEKAEDYSKWLNNMIEIKIHCLNETKKIYKEELEYSREKIIERVHSMGVSNDDYIDQAWNEHLEWRKGQIKYTEKEIRKYSKKLAEIA